MSWFSGVTYKFFTDDVIEKFRASTKGSKDKANAVPPQEFSDMLINGAKELVNGTVVSLVAPIAEVANEIFWRVVMSPIDAVSSWVKIYPRRRSWLGLVRKLRAG